MQLRRKILSRVQLPPAHGHKGGSQVLGVSQLGLALHVGYAAAQIIPLLGLPVGQHRVGQGRAFHAAALRVGFFRDRHITVVPILVNVH